MWNHLHAQDRPADVTVVTEDEVGLSMLIRVPAHLLEKSIHQRFEKTTPVQQRLFGTDSIGQAVCHGDVTCEFEENKRQISFACCISGEVLSETTGVNGPAIIRSSATTKYVAKKRIVFDGSLFTCDPVTISCTTQLKITGIDSTLPRFGGRLVRRIATNRSEELRPQAEAIVQSLTENELYQQINADVASQLAVANQLIRPMIAMIQAIPDLNRRVHVSSSKAGIAVFVHSAELEPSSVAFVKKPPLGKTVEVWLEPPHRFLPQVPATAAVLKEAINWLAISF
jgi:hypothetical protein